MEGHVDAFERDGGEAALEVDGLWLGFSLLCALFDDLDEMLLHVFDAQGFHKLLDVDFLRFEVVGDVCEGVEGAEVAGADVLHVVHVQVDDLQKPAGRLGNVLDHVLQGLLVEGLADAGWVDGAHGVVGAAELVALDGDLHGQTTVEDDSDQALDWHDFSEGGKRTVLAKRVASEAAVSLHYALDSHVLERSLLHKRQSRLCELSCREQSSRGAVGV